MHILRTSACSSVRPTVRPPSVRHTARSAVRPTARSAVRSAPSQLHSNDTFELQLSFNSSNTVHIERKIQVGGHALALKNRKKAFQKSIEKKDERKGETTSSGVRVGGNRAAQGIQRFRSGRLLPSPESKSKTRQHSRRSAADLAGYAIFHRTLWTLGRTSRQSKKMDRARQAEQAKTG